MIFLPVMLLIVLAILIETGRPVLFMHARLGQFGRVFHMLKFRKFKKSCGADGLPLTLSEDERLTHVGKFLRSTKLDELPQLWNVLIGDMSIVGPRPESLAFAECFAGGFRTVLQFKPGLVGPSQAAFRSEAEFIPTKDYSTEFYRTILFPLKALIDIKYYPNRTLAADLMWMVVSFLIILGFALPIVPFQTLKRPSTET